MAESPRTRWPRFVVLLAALTLLLLTAPLVGSFPTRISARLATLTVTLVFVGMLLAAVYAVSGNRRAVIVGVSLVAPVLLSRLVDLVWQREETAVVDHLLSAAFVGYVIVMILLWMFSNEFVTLNMICAALCVYLLLGIGWSILYSLLHLIDPASFHIASATAANDTASLPDTMQFGTQDTVTAFYYSYVTISTLGYGDITPATPSARMLSVVEALTGQLYLAVLVARLVGLHTAQAKRKTAESR